MTGVSLRTFGLFLVLLLGHVTSEVTAENTVSRDQATCKDKDSCQGNLAYGAIQFLHSQLDDDKNGAVDLSESDGFLRDELQYTDGYERHNKFHAGDDTHISVDDLWSLWRHSEVYNWTKEDAIEWLATSVELPQYITNFEEHNVDGTTLPRIAANKDHFLSQGLGIKNPVHKQKLVLKAMDVVLFGPSKTHSYLKDLALVASIVIAIGGCWFAYIQHNHAQTHLKKMIKDLDTLTKAEDSLMELQEKLEKATAEQKNIHEEKVYLENKFKSEIERSKAAASEAKRLQEKRENIDELDISRLRLAEEEIDQLRAMLSQAERQLDDSQWSAPQELQQWLQYTHEIELKHYNSKKAAAEKQLTTAKEGCEKIRKKRNAFMGSLRIAHSSSIDDIDQRILVARSALEEVREDLQERLHRWRQIELYCGFPIITNPGLAVLETAIREGQSNGNVGLTRRGSRDLLDEDLEDSASTYGAASTEPKGRGKFYALGLAAMYGNNAGLSPPPVTLRHSSSYTDVRKRSSLNLENIGLYQGNASPMINRRSLTSETLSHLVRSSSSQDLLAVRDHQQGHSRDHSPVSDVRFSLDGQNPEQDAESAERERSIPAPIPTGQSSPKTHFPFTNDAYASKIFRYNSEQANDPIVGSSPPKTNYPFINEGCSSKFFRRYPELPTDYDRSLTVPVVTGRPSSPTKNFPFVNEANASTFFRNYSDQPTDHERPIPTHVHASSHLPILNAASASPPTHFPRSISLQDHQVQRPPSRPAAQSLSSVDAIGALDKVIDDHIRNSPPNSDENGLRHRMNTQTSITSLTSASSAGTNESETPSIVIEEDDDCTGTGDETHKPEGERKKKKKLFSKLLRKDPDKHKK